MLYNFWHKLKFKHFASCGTNIRQEGVVEEVQKNSRKYMFVYHHFLSDLFTIYLFLPTIIYFFVQYWM